VIYPTPHSFTIVFESLIHDCYGFHGERFTRAAVNILGTMQSSSRSGLNSKRVRAILLVTVPLVLIGLVAACAIVLYHPVTQSPTTSIIPYTAVRDADGNFVTATRSNNAKACNNTDLSAVVEFGTSAMGTSSAWIRVQNISRIGCSVTSQAPVIAMKRGGENLQLNNVQIPGHTGTYMSDDTTATIMPGESISSNFSWEESQQVDRSASTLLSVSFSSINSLPVQAGSNGNISNILTTDAHTPVLVTPWTTPHYGPALADDGSVESPERYSACELLVADPLKQNNIISSSSGHQTRQTTLSFTLINVALKACKLTKTIALTDIEKAHTPLSAFNLQDQLMIPGKSTSIVATCPINTNDIIKAASTEDSEKPNWFGQHYGNWKPATPQITYLPMKQALSCD
jgi:hypothetical protein